MSRRSIIFRTSRRRWIARIIATGMLFLGLITCVVRISWLWSFAAPTGGNVANVVAIEHGMLHIERTKSSTPPANPRSLIVNHQFDPGVSVGLISYSLRGWPGATPGTAITIERHDIGVATILCIVVTMLLGLTFRIIPVPRGHCACGYDLRGIASLKCPECGEAIGQGTA